MLKSVGIMKRLLKRLAVFTLVMFLLPAAVSFAVWQAQSNRPDNWHSANWSSAGILPPAAEVEDAVVHIMAARTGRWKGAFSVHSWIVTKAAGASEYNRYDKVGWGMPIRQNAYVADARWYSNEPEIVKTFRGKEAAKIIPKIEDVVAKYPYSKRGDYNIWPGPNSNTFVAYVLNELPEMEMVLPANAIGRDYLPDARLFHADEDGRNVQFSLGGLGGFAVGRRSGFELSFLGLVFGFDAQSGALKIPGFGTVQI